MRMAVMEGWPGDVLSFLTLALHWEMRMTVMEGWPDDVLSLLSLYLLLSSALRSLSLSLSISVFLSLSSLLPLVFLRVLSALCMSLVPWFPAVAREWPFFTRSCLTIVRHECLCFCEKKQGQKTCSPLYSFCSCVLLCSRCYFLSGSRETETWWRTGGLAAFFLRCSWSLSVASSVSLRRNRGTKVFSILPPVLCFSRGFSVMPAFFFPFVLPPVRCFFFFNLLCFLEKKQRNESLVFFSLLCSGSPVAFRFCPFFPGFLFFFSCPRISSFSPSGAHPFSCFYSRRMACVFLGNEDPKTVIAGAVMAGASVSLAWRAEEDERFLFFFFETTPFEC